jgi:ABC-type multidrug transport system ATPase subunit
LTLRDGHCRHRLRTGSKRGQVAVEGFLSRRTSFVIAHRLSTIRNADQVQMLNEGEIAERGTHDSLMTASGFHHDLYMGQFRYEAELTPDDGREPVEVLEKQPVVAVGDG